MQLFRLCVFFILFLRLQFLFLFRRKGARFELLKLATFFANLLYNVTFCFGCYFHRSEEAVRGELSEVLRKNNNKNVASFYGYIYISVFVHAFGWNMGGAFPDKTNKVFKSNQYKKGRLWTAKTYFIPTDISWKNGHWNFADRTGVLHLRVAADWSCRVLVVFCLNPLRVVPQDYL